MGHKVGLKNSMRVASPRLFLSRPIAVSIRCIFLRDCSLVDRLYFTQEVNERNFSCARCSCLLKRLPCDPPWVRRDMTLSFLFFHVHEFSETFRQTHSVQICLPFSPRRSPSCLASATLQSTHSGVVLMIIW